MYYILPDSKRNEQNKPTVTAFARQTKCNQQSDSQNYIVHAMALPAVDQLERYQWNRGKKHVTATPLNGRTTLTEL